MTQITGLRTATFPPVDYTGLPPAYQTREGRLNLAREYVQARRNIFEGIEIGSEEDRQLSMTQKYCKEEIQIAFDEQEKAEEKQRWEETLRSLNPITRRFFQFFEYLPQENSKLAILYGISLLAISGMAFSASEHPSRAVLRKIGTGALAGTTLICLGIFLKIKQKHLQQNKAI